MGRSPNNFALVYGRGQKDDVPSQHLHRTDTGKYNHSYAIISALPEGHGFLGTRFVLARKSRDEGQRSLSSALNLRLPHSNGVPRAVVCRRGPEDDTETRCPQSLRA